MAGRLFDASPPPAYWRSSEPEFMTISPPRQLLYEPKEDDEEQPFDVIQESQPTYNNNMITPTKPSIIPYFSTPTSASVNDGSSFQFVAKQRLSEPMKEDGTEASSSFNFVSKGTAANTLNTKDDKDFSQSFRQNRNLYQQKKTTKEEATETIPLDLTYGSQAQSPTNLQERAQEAYNRRKNKGILKNVHFGEQQIHHFEAQEEESAEDESTWTKDEQDSVASEYTKTYESEIEDVIKDFFFIGDGNRTRPGRRRRKGKVYQQKNTSSSKYSRPAPISEDPSPPSFVGTENDPLLPVYNFVEGGMGSMVNTLGCKSDEQAVNTLGCNSNEQAVNTLGYNSNEQAVNTLGYNSNEQAVKFQGDIKTLKSMHGGDNGNDYNIRGISNASSLEGTEYNDDSSSDFDFLKPSVSTF
jgi:hypothetical protein